MYLSPVDPVDEQQVEASRACLRERPTEPWSLQAGARQLVGERPHQLPAVLALDVGAKPSVLGLERVRAGHCRGFCGPRRLKADRRPLPRVGDTTLEPCCYGDRRAAST